MIVLAAVLLVTASGVRASENDAVTLKVSLPDLNTSAEHVGIAVYQAAEPEIPGKTDKFVWIPSLNDIGITPEELDTAASVRETAEKLVQEVQKKRDSFQKCNDRPVRNCSVCRAEAGRLSDHTDVRTGDLWKNTEHVDFSPLYR